MIEFLCPNGHKIRCPDERAGQAARCPKCGVRFRIPHLSDDESLDNPAATSRASASRQGQAATLADRQIEFLCPNGHRLHGPASLQGRPGQCPECGSRFRIPSYDVPSEEDEADEEIGVVAASGDTKVTFDDTETLESPKGHLHGELTTALGLENSDAMLSRNGPSPLAELLAKLWAEKASGTVVEVYLTDGSKIMPSHFAPKASQDKHAVFATEDLTGRLTLVVVAWDSVARIEVQGVSRLPDWMKG